MSTTTTSRSRTSIRRRLESVLATDGVEAGERIPTERELAIRLDVSRASVRRVLAELEAEGAVIRHVGRGTFLSTPVQPDNGRISPTDVMLVRRLLEPVVARLIVGTASSEDIAEIRRCVERSEAARTYEEFEQCDGALHRAMVAATHSPLLARIYAVIDQARGDPLWGTLKMNSFSPESRGTYEVDHRRILDAIAARDADAAERAISQHIENVTTRLLR